MKEELLNKMIVHAYNTVPYYKRIFDERGIDALSIRTLDDLKKIPLLYKHQIQSNPNDFFSDLYLKYPKNERINIVRTSGSTGKYLKIKWSIEDEIKSLFSLWTIRNRLYNVKPNSKFCSFYTTLYKGNKFYGKENDICLREKNKLILSKIGFNEQTLDEYYKEIYNFDPEWMMVQPSIAYILADYIEKNNLDLPKSLKYIELAGEFILSEQKEKIKSIFKVNIANQYGSNESNGIAIDCENNNLHILENNVIVEIIENNQPVQFGQEGDIYITSLTNFAMPFIRYKIGDRGIMLHSNNCKCKNDSPIVKLSLGRTTEYISLKNNKKLNIYVFLYVIEAINERLSNPIVEFQIVQNSIQDFSVNFVIKQSFEGWKDTICNEFLQNIIEDELQDKDWNFNFVKRIYPDKKNCKMSFFVNKIKDI
jgi:phenylacetate-CoA ligase